MNFIDVLLIIFLLLGSIKGFKKGFLNSLVGLFSSLIGLFVAIKTHLYLAGWLETKFQLTAGLAQYFEKRLALSQAVSQLKIETLPEKLELSLGEFAQRTGEQMADVCLGDILYLFLAEIVLKVVVIILIWFIVAKGLRLCSHLITKLTENTFLGFINKVGGICTGLLIRVLTLTIIIGLSSPLLKIAPHTEPSFLSAVLQIISEARLVPCFTSAFSLLTGNLLSLWL